ncbi:23S ribosomal RNA methyltransferase Erm [Pueribacillus theae]|uniref:rRNA adenine N-6-methyltransferase n=1 Tax=Pueribacillus theae TaxID=2171751 RepID=A0A2U1JJG7_9BACI|nr:23S ribosomal RNA methyltransferase Erm [Pueribacillus theae]PWA05144.1 23S ribosomal RNA methyltransferase Erm [Pueribacillus theae]
MTRRIHKYSNQKLSRGEPPNFSGQHLMHNKKLLNEMVERANVSKQDTVLELGAGKGALTTVLNQRAGKVLAVEYDSKFVEILEWKTALNPNTTIVHQDIMKIHLPKEKFVVVSNIPFSITTPIMKMLLSNPSNALQRGIIVMEKGAAKRFTSKFVKNAYVLAWRMWFDLHYVKEISRTNFSPPPKVDCAMVLINRKKEPIIPIKDRVIFIGLAEYALREPRATIEMALKGIFTPPQMKHLKRNLGIKNEITIGSLTESQWGIVFRTMIQYVQRPLWPKTKKKR